MGTKQIQRTASPAVIVEPALIVGGLSWIFDKVLEHSVGATGHEICYEFARGAWRELTGTPTSLRNHEIVRAVRRAHLDALEGVLARFGEEFIRIDEQAPDPTVIQFLSDAAGFCRRERGRLAQEDLELNFAPSEALTAAVDSLLADQPRFTLAGARAIALGSFAEDAVLEELAVALEPIAVPRVFADYLRGNAEKDQKCFLGLFAAGIVAQLKDPQHTQFRSIVQTAWLADLKALGYETTEILTRLEAQFGTLLGSIKSDTVALLGKQGTVEGKIDKIDGSIRVVTERLSHYFQLGVQDGQQQTSLGTDELSIYAERLRQTYDVIDLTALAQPGAVEHEEPKPKLTHLFVPQYIRRSRLFQSLPRDYLISQGIDPAVAEAEIELLGERWQKAERQPALTFVSTCQEKIVILLGDPGTGKSSLVRFIALNLAQHLAGHRESVANWVSAYGNRVPFLIELRDYIARYTERRCSNFLDYLTYVGEELGVGFSGSQVKTALEEMDSLLIFDGLDEIFDPVMRSTISKEIVGFSARHQRSRLIVTSRIAGFNAHVYESNSAAMATLDDLDDEQIRIFAAHWFGFRYQNDSSQGDRARKDLLEAIDNRPSVRVLASNPMLLTIMAIVAQHEQLARSRIGLYAQALKVLCYTWEFRKELSLADESPVRDLTAGDKLLLLQKVAWEMQKDGDALRANAIAEQRLREAIESYFEREWSFDKQKRRRATTEMVDLLQVRNWILTPRGPSLFGFVHRTFLEYLCAMELVDLFQNHEIDLAELRDEYILAHVTDDSWREVIRLVTAQLSPRHAAELIRAILQSQEGITSGERLAIAFQCLAEQEGRKFQQLREVCEIAISSLYGRIDSFNEGEEKLRELEADRPYYEHIASALDVIRADWPVTDVGTNHLPEFGSISANLIPGLLRSVWAKSPGTNAVLKQLMEHPFNIVRQSICNVPDLSDADIAGHVRAWTAREPDEWVRRRLLLKWIETRKHSIDDEFLVWITQRIVAEVLPRVAGEVLRSLLAAFGSREAAKELVFGLARDGVTPIQRKLGLWLAINSVEYKLASDNIGKQPANEQELLEARELLLRRCIDDDSRPVRKEAAGLLMEVVGPNALLNLLTDIAVSSEPIIERFRASELARTFLLEDSTFQTIVEQLVGSCSTAAEARQVLSLLLESAPDWLVVQPQLLETLLCRHGDDDDRIEMISLLRNAVSDAPSVGLVVLRRALFDDQACVRLKAVSAIGEVWGKGSADYAPPLLWAAATDPNLDVARAALGAWILASTDDLVVDLFPTERASDAHGDTDIATHVFDALNAGSADATFDGLRRVAEADVARMPKRLIALRSASIPFACNDTRSSH